MRAPGTALACGAVLILLTSCASTHGDLAPASQNLADATEKQAPAGKELFVLLPDPDGKVGGIVVTNRGGSQLVAEAGYATEISGPISPPSAPFRMLEPEIARTFEAALAAQPDPPVRFLLYFGSGSTDLTQDSRKTVPEILAVIQARHSTDLSIVGHTDRVGSRAMNQTLGLERADRIRNMLILDGVESSSIQIESHGEDRPVVETEDDTPEPRNRRVEVVVR